MEICTVGGFNEVGKNMVAVKTGEDVFIFDAGLYIPGIVELQEENLVEYAHRFQKRGAKPQQYSEKKLRDFGAIPDDTVLDELGWSKKVVAIFISHAHLDHLGGISYIAHRYPQATIYGTAFTIKLLETIIEDEKIKLKNKIKVVEANSTHTIIGKSGSYNVDFIHTTHSTIHCVFPALHTKEGIFFYALDLKFDNFPTFGAPPNYAKMRELGRKGVKIALIDALYSGTEAKPGGERVAQHLMEEAFSKVHEKNSAFFVTTFSSHIERLMNIVKLAKKTKREIVFLGRSLAKNVEAASKVNAWPFKDIKLLKYARQRESFFKTLEKNRGRYFIVCTGHQAEENSVLDRIVKGSLPFKFRAGDNLIFSSSVIPVPINIVAREKMDSKLRKIGVKIQTNVHVHGHGSREDMRELIAMVKPKHIIPAHGSLQQTTPLAELAGELGYKVGREVHIMQDGQKLRL
ncbi:MAG: MBL fold metallo-hydrolase RNA specificity domain-containing protein [Nanoarchaeota archaeon]|nr:MBL fold metallo-hydrolase RNA specificity domain-containing protein [Nanoarchaeota archaeon]